MAETGNFRRRAPVRKKLCDLLPDYLSRLQPQKTECPGRLAKKLGVDMAALRGALLALEEEGKIRILQRG